MLSHRLIYLLIFLSIISILAGLSLGSFFISPWKLGQFSSIDPTLQDIVVTLRLPRTLAAYAIGGLLALTGCLMQSLFQNPLADSYLLGTSSGASLGMLTAVIIGLQGIWLPAFAAIGAWLAVAFVLGFVKVLFFRQEITPASPTLLLIGVMVTALLNTIVLLLLTLLPDHALRGAIFWIIGDLSFPEYWPIASFILFIALFLSTFFGQTLNIFSYGTQQAKALGVPIHWVFWITTILIGLAAGISVAIAGPVGFIGLMIPHLGRKLVGYDLRKLLPVSVALGGILLVMADVLSRSLAAPLQLPIGIFTSLLGAPCFLWLLFKRREYH